jgi:hypothetical protein
MTENVQVLLFRSSSVAVMVTVVVPDMTVPTAGNCDTEGEPSQLSETIAEPV